MDLFDRLRAVTQRAQQQDDLPDLLAERLFRIADEPARYRDCDAELLELIGMVEDYDTFGQTGYIGMGVDHFILAKALDRFEAR